MFFFSLFLLSNFPQTLGGFGDTSNHSDAVSEKIFAFRHLAANSTSLEPEESSASECTTSSVSRDFSGCHTEEIVQYKAVFIANAAAVVSIGAPANLITLLALPYVRLRWKFLLPIDIGDVQIISLQVLKDHSHPGTLTKSQI